MNHRWSTVLTAQGVLARWDEVGVRDPKTHPDSWGEFVVPAERSTCDPFGSGDGRNGEVCLLWINGTGYSGLVLVITQQSTKELCSNAISSLGRTREWHVGRRSSRSGLRSLTKRMNLALQTSAGRCRRLGDWHCASAREWSFVVFCTYGGYSVVHSNVACPSPWRASRYRRSGGNCW